MRVFSNTAYIDIFPVTMEDPSYHSPEPSSLEFHPENVYVYTTSASFAGLGGRSRYSPYVWVFSIYGWPSAKYEIVYSTGIFSNTAYIDMSPVTTEDPSYHSPEPSSFEFHPLKGYVYLLSEVFDGLSGRFRISPYT